MAPRTPARGDAPSSRDPGPSRLVVALVRGFRGLRGQVRVELLTDRPAERFAPGSRLYPEGTDEGLIIVEALPVADGPGWWLRFAEIGDRALAEGRLRDRYLEIEAPDEPREAGRWYWHELLGIAVSSTGGEDLGTVVDIYRAGGAEVFVVRGPRGEFDVPGVRGIVTELAPDRGSMVVDLDRLALDARPVEDEDYVRPRDRRPHRQRKGQPGRPGAAGAASPGAVSLGAASPGAGSPSTTLRGATPPGRAAPTSPEPAPPTPEPEPGA